MPRKSAAAALVEQVVADPVRPDAPYVLNDEEAAVWRQIIGSVPPKWFAAFQFDHLCELCRHIVEARYVKRQLDAERAKRKPNLKLANEWKRQWMAETTLITAMMRSMRLTQMSVYHPVTSAKRQAREAGPVGAADEVWALNGADADTDDEAADADAEI